jgi:hypothetical protein
MVQEMPPIKRMGQQCPPPHPTAHILGLAEQIRLCHPTLELDDLKRPCPPVGCTPRCQAPAHPRR